MNKVTTEVRHVDLNGQRLIAILELINANDNQFEISLNSLFAEGSVFSNTLHGAVIVDIIGYDRRDPDQEIVIQREEEIELSLDDIEAAEIQFEVAHRGALESDPLPMLTDMETMMCLGEDAKIVVRFEVK
jgi:hypothetical protein